MLRLHAFDCGEVKDAIARPFPPKCKITLGAVMELEKNRAL